MILRKVISGGQTGVDQVGLLVARTLGYQTGGMAPLGWKTDAGPNPDLLQDIYGLTECQFAGYRIRTRWNVRQSDATVWFGQFDSPGKRCTVQEVERLNKPFLSNPNEQILRSWLDAYPIAILNVAGHRLRTHPEAAAEAERVLRLGLR